MVSFSTNMARHHSTLNVSETIQHRHMHIRPLTESDMWPIELCNRQRLIDLQLYLKIILATCTFAVSGRKSWRFNKGWHCRWSRVSSEGHFGYSAHANYGQTNGDSIGVMRS